MAIRLLKRTTSTKKISTKRSINASDLAKEYNFQVCGNTVNPEILFVVDPIITDFNKNPKKALNKKQLSFMGKYLHGKVPFDKVMFLTAAPPAEKLVFDRDKAIGDHLKDNRDKFANTCKLIKPKFIVAMGKLGGRQVYGRAVQITKIRGLPDDNAAWGLPILPVLGVNHVMRYPENQPLFEADLDTVSRIYQNKYKLDYQEAFKAEYKWVTDLSHWLRRPPEELIVDIEGVGLDPFDPKSKILTVQLCAEEGKAEAVDIRDRKNPRVKRIISQLKKLLENPKVKCIGHNLKFDFKMIREKLGITIANYEWDTMVMAHLVDENMLGFNLADLTRRYVPIMAGYSDEFDRDPIHQGKTRMDLVPPDKLLKYGCGDVDATFRLYNVLRKKIDADDYFPNYYNRVLRPGLRAFCDIERYGFTIDKSALQDFEKYLRKTQKEARLKILKMIPKAVRKDFAQYKNVRDENNNIVKQELPFNITRGAFLVGMCFKHPKGLKLKPVVFTPSTANEKDPAKRVPSTSTKDHFPYFEGEPFIDAITEYIKNEKLLTTYVGTEDVAEGEAVTGFYKYIKNGCIRPSYLFTGTDTGRLSSREPNGQNFPKRGEAATRYRRMFVAPPGWVLVDADLSQIELRGAAYLANEQTMIRFFREGIDLHAATAARVIGISIKEFLKKDSKFVKQKRFEAKAVNFGFLYGMWWKKFMSYAKTQYKVDFTEEQAAAIRVAFFELYPDLLTWHQEVGEKITRDGYIRSPFGRKRHLPSVYSDDEMVSKAAIRKGINAPNQSFASDLGVIAIGMLHEAGIDPDKFRIVGFIHDDIICMARVDYAVLAARTLRKYMQNVPIKKWFGVDFPCPIVAEAAIGYNLSDMVEVNEYIDDKSVKTLADIRAKIKAKLDKVPDTEENAKKRGELEKEIQHLLPPEGKKPSTAKRKLRLKSKSKRSNTHAHQKEETAKVSKIKLARRKGRKTAEAARGDIRPSGRKPISLQRRKSA